MEKVRHFLKVLMFISYQLESLMYNFCWKTHIFAGFFCVKWLGLRLNNFLFYDLTVSQCFLLTNTSKNADMYFYLSKAERYRSNIFLDNFRGRVYLKNSEVCRLRKVLLHINVLLWCCVRSRKVNLILSPRQNFFHGKKIGKLANSSKLRSS